MAESMQPRIDQLLATLNLKGDEQPALSYKTFVTDDDDAIPPVISGQSQTVVSDGAQLRNKLRAMSIVTDSEQAPAAGADAKGQPFAVLRSRDEEYRILQVIGKGGQGEVWEALQVDLGRVVAVKRSAEGNQAQLNFLREAFTAAQLDHPNIVATYELGAFERNGRKAPMIAMKKIVGRSWNEVLKADRAAPGFRLDAFLSKHLQIFVQVTNAISYAHAKRIIHRDLKPSQVMIGEYGEVFLLDWGLAVYVGEHVETPDAPQEEKTPSDTAPRFFTLQTAANPAGSPAYMAPEQTETSSQVLGVHTDIYLLGAILYELMSGAPPHGGKTVASALVEAHLNKVTPLPYGAPEELAEIVMHCLASRPEDRPSSAREIHERVESYLTGAGRRDQSRRITDDLRDGEQFTDYDGLSDALQRLSQASTLWVDNPDLQTCRDRLLDNFVDVAVAKNDFLLAALQAGRVSSHEHAEQLAARVDAARERAAQRLRKPPLLNPARVLAILLSWVVVAATVVGIIYEARNVLTDEIRANVASLARLAAREVEAEDLDEVSRSLEVQTGAFQRVLNRLNLYRLANADVRHIYALRPSPAGGQAWQVLVDGDPRDLDINVDGEIGREEKGVPPGTTYPRGRSEMVEAFRGREPTSAVADTPRGSFISGYAPVLDRLTREPVGIVGVDAALGGVAEKMEMVRRAAITGGVILVLLMTTSFLGIFASRRALAFANLLEKEIQKQNSELRGRQLTLG